MRNPVKTAKRQLLRVGSCALSALMVLGSIPAAAIGDGVTATYDEAYYAMTDYYGNLTDGSVVKSYRTNGIATLTDYGDYDEIINLTDGTVPARNGGMTTFRLDEKALPGTFYFEGKTTKPFQQLPWTISMSYTLNGVPTKAEDLAGQAGVVEIRLDIVPNERASEYARNNYTLEAMTIFNQDDILSLEAPGAQVQLIGNLRAVLFLGLPGEECHYTIRVGSEDFAFGGMTFLMVPATLSQLEEIAKLSERKDDLEDNYNKLSGSIDSLLDAMTAMTGSLNASANGLEQLNKARGIFSDGKGVIYSGTDALREDLSNLADVLEPVEGQIETLSKTISDSKSTLRSMTNTVSDLKGDLKDVESALRDLEDGTGDVRKVFSALGAEDSVDYGMITVRAKELNGAHIFFDKVSVGATMNGMLSAVMAKGQTILENCAKEPHVVDLANFLNMCGADVRGAGTDVIKVRGVEQMHGCTYSIIPDQIEAGSYMVAAAATGGDVLVKNVTPKHLEPITAKLRRAGIEVEEFDDAVRVRRTGDILPLKINTMPHPGFPTDMQPLMGVLLSVAKGTSTVTESVWDNRFRYVDELRKMGANVQVDGQVAVFEGVEKLSPAPLRASDLRAGAAMVVAALMADGTSEIEEIGHIERGYENIVEKLRGLGADIKKVERMPAALEQAL